MAITVKKKRPITVKAPDSTPETAAPSAPAAPAAPAFTPPAFAQEGPSYTPYAILALIATLMFVALLFMQWTELQYYRDAFPQPQATAASS